jgi:hypothetical protein
MMKNHNLYFKHLDKTNLFNKLLTTRKSVIYNQSIFEFAVYLVANYMTGK